MKICKYFSIVLLLIAALVSGCGSVDRILDEESYEEESTEIENYASRYDYQEYEGPVGITPAVIEIEPIANDPDITRIYWFFNERGIQIPADNFFSQRAREEIGIDFVPINPEALEFEDILFAMLEAGQQIDVIMTWRELQAQLADEGFIMPVQEWLNESYLPNLIRVSSIWDESLMASLRHNDGNIYAIPSVNNMVLPGTHDWIRVDWLRNVDMEIPTTYAELTAVLRAFAALALEDEYQEFYPLMASGIGGFEFIFEAFAADGHWYMAEDGYLELGILSTRVVEVLQLMNTWYEEGLINRDFFLTLPDEVSKWIIAGQVGYHRGWSSFYYSAVMQEQNPEAQWMPIVPLQSPYFDQGYYNYIRPTEFTRNQYSVHINANIEAVLMLINWMNEDTATSLEPGNMTFEGAYWYQFGERGVHWDVLDGYFVGPGGADDWINPDKQEAAQRFAAAVEIDTWTWTLSRFINRFDTRWMSHDPHDIALLEWEMEHIINAGRMATDIPHDHRYLARAVLETPANEAFLVFIEDFTSWGSWDMFAEYLAYPAIMGMDDIQTLYDQWLYMANQQGYQEFRRAVTAH